MWTSFVLYNEELFCWAVMEWFIGVFLHLSVFVCALACMCFVFACVGKRVCVLCVTESERKRNGDKKREMVCVCVCVRQRERENLLIPRVCLLSLPITIVCGR